MPITKSAKARVKTNEKARSFNKNYKSMMRTAIKNVLQAENSETAEIALKNAVSIIDKLARKRIIPKNNASNKKSKLARHVNTLLADKS